MLRDQAVGSAPLDKISALGMAADGAAAPAPVAERGIPLSYVLAGAVLADLLVLTGAGLTAWHVTGDGAPSGGGETVDPSWTAVPFAALVMLTLALPKLSRGPSVWSDLWPRPGIVLCHLPLSVGLAVLLAWQVTGAAPWSRDAGLLWLALAAVGIVAVRLGFRTALLRTGARWRVGARFGILGTSRSLPEMLDGVTRRVERRGHVTRVYQAGTAPEEVPAALAAVVEDVRLGRIDQVVIVPDGRGALLTQQALTALAPTPVRVLMAVRTACRGCQGATRVTLRTMLDLPLSDWQRLVKRTEDVVVSLLVLVLAAPIYLAIAIAIKLDSPGPVFFRQKRYGYNSQLFEILKFRTMRHDVADYEATKLVERNDPRTTRVGAWLRRSSLDELPQFINVLKGDMSIVGPRPHARRAKAGDHIYDELIADFSMRYKVRPGITGWAQINHCRGNTDTEEKLIKRMELDFYYLSNWSIFFDLYIIVATPWAALWDDNAY